MASRSVQHVLEHYTDTIDPINRRVAYSLASRNTNQTAIDAVLVQSERDVIYWASPNNNWHLSSNAHAMNHPNTKDADVRATSVASVPFFLLYFAFYMSYLYCALDFHRPSDLR